MTVKEAIVALNVNAVIACERAGFSSAIVKMIEDALDTIEDALKERQWVSVKDRLPERKWTDYLVATRVQTDGTKGVNIAWLNDDDGVWSSNDKWICDGREIVTHWMPLPELPKDGNGE